MRSALPRSARFNVASRASRHIAVAVAKAHARTTTTPTSSTLTTDLDLNVDVAGDVGAPPKLTGSFLETA